MTRDSLKMATGATRVNHVVVDSGAFIRNVPLQLIGVNIITIQDVVSEIKDKATKERLQVLPYQLNFREPSQEAIKTVSEFSKKTGDYASLSAVDIRVLALTYQLEKEHVGCAHIKTVPDTKITWSATKSHLENPAEIAGFYIGKKKNPGRSTKSSECSSTDNNNPSVETGSDYAHSALADLSLSTKPEKDEPTVYSQNFNMSEKDVSEKLDSEDFPAMEESTVSSGVSTESTATSATFSWANVVKKPATSDQPSPSTADCACDETPLDMGDQSQKDTSKENGENDSSADKNITGSEERTSSISADEMKSEKQEENVAQVKDEGKRMIGEGDTLLTEELGNDEEDEEDDEDEDDGWITPSNIKEVKAAMGDVNSEPARVEVGCLTTDFSMQNVLIQMGLNVVSVEGMLIKKAKSYVLRCYGCYKVSTNITREFCHHCGNKTLQRVSMTVNDDGSIKYFLSRRRAVNARGTKFSLPMPKGGKHATNPVLCEDQQGPHQRTARKSKVKYNVFDPNYSTHTSPFAPIDTQSKSAQLGIRDFKHAFRNKRNPNENKKVYGRRK